MDILVLSQGQSLNPADVTLDDDDAAAAVDDDDDDDCNQVIRRE